MRNLSVVQVEINGMIGYQIQGLYRDCSDSFFEDIAHAAVFRDEIRAKNFLKKVESRPSWEYDWKYWGKPVGYVHSYADSVQKTVPVYTVL